MRAAQPFLSPNPKPQPTPNPRTTNAKQQTPSTKTPTRPNTKHQTPNTKHQPSQPPKAKDDIKDTQNQIPKPQTLKQHDPEWLAIMRAAQPFLSLTRQSPPLPPPSTLQASLFRLTEPGYSMRQS